MPSTLRYALIGVIVVAVQWLVLGRLKVFGAYPDAVLLYVAWLSLRRGRQTGAIAGFGLGLLMDVAYQTWGVYMFVKTLVGFLVGLFPASERETLIIQPQQAFLGGLVIALLHNALFVIFLILQTGARSTFALAVLWLGSAAYTALVAVVVTLFYNR